MNPSLISEFEPNMWAGEGRAAERERSREGEQERGEQEREGEQDGGHERE